MSRFMIRKNIFAFVLIAFFIALPMLSTLLLSNVRNYITLIGFNILMYMAMGSAWNIIGGFGRQISWAHASFFAVGAYVSMIMLLRSGISPWLSMLVGALIAGILAFFMGFASFRFHGVFFSLATIAFGQIIYRLLLYFTDFTGGASGLVMRKIESDNFFMMQFMNGDTYYYLMLVFTILIVLLCIWIERSRLGYYLKAIREDETACQSLGLKPYKVKLMAFIISAMIMSIIGTLYTVKFKYIDPESVSSQDLAIRIGMTVIIGGIGTIWGPLLGSLISVPLLELTNAFFGNVLNGGLSLALYGGVLVVMVIFLPGGVISLRDSSKHLRRVARGQRI